ncbi:MAG: phosphopantetheine-binding protein [Desulfobacteraceae bacterium]|nr:phosphopantetheine-binding protein [Desulfobacteraceae bacterium]
MKQTLIPEQKILEEVRKTVAEGLNIKQLERVRPESSLMRDLGAESLDFLDIDYRLEQAFGIRLARHSVVEHMEEMFGEESAIDSDGKLTEKAAKVFNLRFKDSGQEVRAGMDMDSLPAMVTVRSLCDGVMNLLDTLPEACTGCGGKEWKIKGGVLVQCASCGEPASYADGDDLIDEWLRRVQEREKIF